MGLQNSTSLLQSILQSLQDLKSDVEDMKAKTQEMESDIDRIEEKFENFTINAIPSDIAEYHAQDHRDIHARGPFKRFVLWMLGENHANNA